MAEKMFRVDNLFTDSDKVESAWRHNKLGGNPHVYKRSNKTFINPSESFVTYPDGPTPVSRVSFSIRVDRDASLVFPYTPHNAVSSKPYYQQISFRAKHMRGEVRSTLSKAISGPINKAKASLTLPERLSAELAYYKGYKAIPFETWCLLHAQGMPAITLDKSYPTGLYKVIEGKLVAYHIIDHIDSHAAPIMTVCSSCGCPTRDDRLNLNESIMCSSCKISRRMRSLKSNHHS